MAGMTDGTLVAHLMDNMLHTSTASTYTAGTGGTTISWTVPLHLRLYTTPARKRPAALSARR